MPMKSYERGKQASDPEGPAKANQTAAVSIISIALVWLDRIEVGADGTGFRA